MTDAAQLGAFLDGFYIGLACMLAAWVPAAVIYTVRKVLGT